MKVEAIVCGCVVALDPDVLLIAVQPDQGVVSSNFHVRMQGSWFGYQQEPAWIPSGMAGLRYPESGTTVVASLSPAGDAWELMPRTQQERLLKIGTDHQGITGVSMVGDAIYACGMGRVVFRRGADGLWNDVSAPPATTPGKVIGFNAIAGDNDLVIAVGWGGEIWTRANGSWSMEDSCTDRNLNALSVGSNGEVVVVGDRGTIVRGRPGQWTAVSFNSSFDFQGICHFGGEVFLCTNFEIFRLVDDTVVRETRFAAAGPDTCMNFLVGKNSLYSQGERDLFSFDGARWAKLL